MLKCVIIVYYNDFDITLKDAFGQQFISNNALIKVYNLREINVFDFINTGETYYITKRSTGTAMMRQEIENIGRHYFPHV